MTYRHLVVVISIQLAAVVAHDATPSIAATPSLVKCQNAIIRAGEAYLPKKLTALSTCSTKLLLCIQKSPNDSRCLTNASSKCLERIAAIDVAKRSLITAIADTLACGALPSAAVTDVDKLGFANVAGLCFAQFGIQINDGVTLAECIERQYSCQADVLFQVQQPRAYELFRLIGLPDKQIDAFFGCGDKSIHTEKLCASGDKGGETCSTTNDCAGSACEFPRLQDSGSATALLKCQRQYHVAAIKAASRELNAVNACLKSLFACSQKPVAKQQACFSHARDTCAKQKANAHEASALLDDDPCAPPQRQSPHPKPTVTFASVLSQNGSSRVAQGCTCAAMGVANLADFTSNALCVQNFHECRTSELATFTVPRAQELLQAVNLEQTDFLCSLPPAVGLSRPALTSSQANVTAGSIHDVITAVSQPGGPPVPTTPGAFLHTGDRTIETLRGRRRILPNSASAIVLSLTDNIKTVRVAARELRFGRLLDDFFELTPQPDVNGNVTLITRFPQTTSGCFELNFMTVGNDVDETISQTVPLTQADVPEIDTAVLQLTQVEQEDVSDVVGADPVKGLQGARWIVVSPDDQYVYVSSASNEIGTCKMPADATLPFCHTNADCGPQSPEPNPCTLKKTTPDGLVVFRRDASTGRLTYLQSVLNGVNGVTGLTNALSVAVSSDSLFVYVAGGDDNSVVVFKRDDSTGLLSMVSSVKENQSGVTGIREPRSLYMSPDGKHLYVAGRDDDAVAVFSRNANDGSLGFVQVKKNGDADGTTGLSGVNSLTVSANGLNVYAAGLVDNSVVVFSRDPSTGTLTFKETQVNGVGGNDGIDSARDVSLSPDDRFLYVCGGPFANAVAAFERNLTDGTLQFVEVQKNLTGELEGFRPTASVVSTDGAYLFVAGGTGPDVNGDGPDRTVAVFRRNTTTGRLTFVKNAGGSNVTEGVSVAVDGNGSNVYATGERTRTVAVFDIVSAP
jgi:6-phosphogluconolactonase (cycloisomerase 2 family)